MMLASGAPRSTGHPTESESRGRRSGSYAPPLTVARHWKTDSPQAPTAFPHALAAISESPGLIGRSLPARGDSETAIAHPPAFTRHSLTLVSQALKLKIHPQSVAREGPDPLHMSRHNPLEGFLY